jgi:hypothetical protein
MKPIPRVPFTIRRKVTELDVGDVFLYEGHAYRVRRVGDLWNEPDGNFQSLFVDSDYGMRNHWFPLRASKVVRVQSKANSTGGGADLSRSNPTDPGDAALYIVGGLIAVGLVGIVAYQFYVASQYVGTPFQTQM